MRFHDHENDRTLPEVTVYLTTSEIAQLYAYLGSMLTDIRVTECRVGDDGYRHQLSIHLYNDHEMTGFDERQRQIVSEDR